MKLIKVLDTTLRAIRKYNEVYTPTEDELSAYISGYLDSVIHLIGEKKYSQIQENLYEVILATYDIDITIL